MLYHVTQFSYDNQGNLSDVIYPDGYIVYDTYNPIRQLVAK